MKKIKVKIKNYLKEIFFYKKGFSLVELLIVVSILGIISAIAISSYGSYKKNSKRQVVHNVAVEIQKALQTCLNFADGDINKCNTWEKLGVECDHHNPDRTTAFTNGWSHPSGNKLKCTGYMRDKLCLYIYYKDYGKKEGSTSCVDSEGNIVKGNDTIWGICSSSGSKGPKCEPRNL